MTIFITINGMKIPINNIRYVTLNITSQHKAILNKNKKELAN